MKHILLAKLTLGAVVAAAVITVPGVSARAHEDSATNARAQAETRQVAAQDSQQRGEAIRNRAESAREEAKIRLEAKKAEITQQLDEKRQEVCERREQKINAITDKSVEQARKHLAVFQKIEDRVKAYHTNKALIAENYDALLAEVDAKEAAAVAAIESTGVIDLDCAVEGDQRQIGTFIKDLVRAQHAALREYRTAIKNLIVAVAQAQKQAEGAQDATTQQESNGTGAPQRPSTRQEGTR